MGTRLDCLGTCPAQGHRDLWRSHRRVGRACPRTDGRNRPAGVLSARAAVSRHCGWTALRGARGRAASRPQPDPRAASLCPGSGPANGARRVAARLAARAAQRLTYLGRRMGSGPRPVILLEYRPASSRHAATDPAGTRNRCSQRSGGRLLARPRAPSLGAGDKGRSGGSSGAFAADDPCRGRAGCQRLRGLDASVAVGGGASPVGSPSWPYGARMAALVWRRSSAPEHIVPPGTLEADPPAEADRRAFSIIAACATQGIILSRSRRYATGRADRPEPAPPVGHKRALARTDAARRARGERIGPASGAAAGGCGASRDRLRPAVLAELAQAGSDPPWTAGGRRSYRHRGKYRGPPIADFADAAAARSSRLRLEICPGMARARRPERPLVLPPDEFGRLVHELLRRAVDTLEPTPGFTVARTEEIEDALGRGGAARGTTWPLERPVRQKCYGLTQSARRPRWRWPVLTRERFTESGTRSWTEVPFGRHTEPPEPTNAGWPWDPALRVGVPGTAIAIRGKIDRVDLRAGAIAVRVMTTRPANGLRTPPRWSLLVAPNYSASCTGWRAASSFLRHRPSAPAHLSERRARDLLPLRPGWRDCADRSLCERGLRCPDAWSRCPRPGCRRPS